MSSTLRRCAPCTEFASEAAWVLRGGVPLPLHLGLLSPRSLFQPGLAPPPPPTRSTRTTTGFVDHKRLRMNVIVIASSSLARTPFSTSRPTRSLNTRPLSSPLSMMYSSLSD
ncbi:hypothetical protein FRB95_009330 [Tulasnella sp. JGI-2019a]|nr:hypothetical protein FRB95_009330 [Tulasnella sp. JGI-2019a]